MFPMPNAVRDLLEKLKNCQANTKWFDLVEAMKEHYKVPDGMMWVEKNFGSRRVGQKVVVSGEINPHGGLANCESWILVSSNYVNKSGIYSGKDGETYQVVVGSERVVAIDLATGQPYTVECETGKLRDIDNDCITNFQLILENDSAKDS